MTPSLYERPADRIEAKVQQQSSLPNAADLDTLRPHGFCRDFGEKNPRTCPRNTLWILVASEYKTPLSKSLECP